MTEIAEPARPNAVFTPLAVLWMVLVGVFSFSAFMVLTAYAPELRSGSDGGGHALSHSAVGYAGAVDLLRGLGETVVISRTAERWAPPVDDDAPDAPAPPKALLILTPVPGSDVKDIAVLLKGGPSLVVLPKWETRPIPANPAFVSKAGPIDKARLAPLLKALSAKAVVLRRVDLAPVRLQNPADPAKVDVTGPIDQLQVLAPGSDLTPIAVDARGDVVVAASADRKLFILSDPDLLNTQGLANLATARAGIGLVRGLRAAGAPIVFDVSLNGFGAAPSVLKLAFSPPYLGLTLSLFAIGVLIGLHAASRFGAVAHAGRAIAFGKAMLADNSAGLIRLARREPHMAGRYLELCRQAVVAALGITRQADAELNEVLDRIAERQGVEERLSVLAPAAKAVRTRAELMRVSRALYKWRVEMTRERR